MIRSVATLMVAYLLLLLQSTVLELAPAAVPAPALGVLVALHVGLSSRWSAPGAAAIGFTTGYLFDLMAGAPQGVHALVFILVVLFARALSTRMAVRGFVFSAATGFVASLLGSFLVVAVRAYVSPQAGFGTLRLAPFEALLTGFFAPPVLALLRRIDGRLDPGRPRVGIARGARELGDGLLR